MADLIAIGYPDEATADAAADEARRLAQDRAELFVVPNMGPLEWGAVERQQHRLMFRMRAAECGRWLARADVAGGTSVVDPDGVETARVHVSDAVRLLFHRIAADQAFPLELKVPNAETRAAMAEAEAIIRSGKLRFRAPEELFADLDENSAG